jgi:HAMP domain-containing protein
MMMQWLRTYQRTFAARLLAIMASLIVLTTLGAGAPAYLGARSALEERSWAQVADAGETTLALLWAEQARLTTLARLLAERPTLRRLLEEGSDEELQHYLDDFRRQSALDQLLLCTPEQTIRTGAHAGDNCHGHDQARMITSGGQLQFTAGDTIAESASRVNIGVTVDAAWLNKLSGQQSTFAGIYRSDGSSMLSALPDDLPLLALPGPTNAVQARVDHGGQPLYLWLKPFPAELTEQPLWLAVSLPVAFLDANNQRALAILLVSTLLITVAGLSLATWFVRRLTRPLELLRSVAEMVAQGNLETTVPVVAGPIEVESLAHALRGSQQRMRTALDEAAHTNQR